MPFFYPFKIHTRYFTLPFHKIIVQELQGYTCPTSKWFNKKFGPKRIQPKNLSDITRQPSLRSWITKRREYRCLSTGQGFLRVGYLSHKGILFLNRYILIFLSRFSLNPFLCHVSGTFCSVSNLSKATGLLLLKAKRVEAKCPAVFCHITNGLVGGPVRQPGLNLKRYLDLSADKFC